MCAHGAREYHVTDQRADDSDSQVHLSSVYLRIAPHCDALYLMSGLHYCYYFVAIALVNRQLLATLDHLFTMLLFGQVFGRKVRRYPFLWRIISN